MDRASRVSQQGALQAGGPGALSLALAILWTLVLVGMPAASESAARPMGAHEFTDCVSTAKTACLRLWLSGFGKVDVRVDDERTTSCDYTDILENQRECAFPVPRRSEVSLTAVAQEVPEYGSLSEFVRWSRFDCRGKGPCTFNAVDGNEWVVATFTPLKLELDQSGDGTVHAPPPPRPLPPYGFSCPPDCTPSYGLYPAGQRVKLTATPAPGNVLRWQSGCEPADGDPSSSTCTVTMTNVRTFATVAFGPPGTELVPPDFPFQIGVNLRVNRRGSGRGKVTGSGINCGSKCVKSFLFQEKVTLTAKANLGSRFVGWRGVCGTQRTCRFSAGSATKIAARFDRRR